MLQCIGFASWRDGEREKEREKESEEGEGTGEVRGRGNHRRAVELRQDRFVQVYGCMTGWQSVSLSLHGSLSLTHTHVHNHTCTDNTVTHPNKRAHIGLSDLFIWPYMFLLKP